MLSNLHLLLVEKQGFLLGLYAEFSGNIEMIVAPIIV